MLLLLWGRRGGLCMSLETCDGSVCAPQRGTRSGPTSVHWTSDVVMETSCVGGETGEAGAETGERAEGYMAGGHGCHMYVICTLRGAWRRRREESSSQFKSSGRTLSTARQSVERTLYTTRMWARRVYNHIIYSYTTYKCQINPASPGSPVGPAPLACSSLQSPQPRTLRPGSHTPVAIVSSQQCSHPCKTVSTDLVKRKHQVQFTDVLEKRICTYFASQLPNIATSPIPG